jgi:hydroxyacylglutathione hydrolase
VVGALDDVERVLLDHPEVAERARRMGAEEVAEWAADAPSPTAGGLQLLDVRNPGEQDEGVIAGARRIPIARLLERVDELDPSAPTIVYCAGGYRSSIAASLLRTRGFSAVADLQGGFEAWVAAGLPVATTP